jgi:hypothetical protein
MTDSTVFGIGGRDVSSQMAKNPGFGLRMYAFLGSFAAARVREHIGDPSGEISNPDSFKASFDAAIARLGKAPHWRGDWK